ncbi:MAG: spore coat associated protein CotJA [Clostridia bacterium]|nr:spore coat associated protein CotJA [Clostridia bacterium]
MLYVPYQRWEKLYSEEEALERGTLFRALDLPFLGGRKIR